MYTLVRRFIKTGIVFLAVGIALGVWMLFEREVRGGGIHPSLVSAHAHAVLAGFVMFLILGLALWLFPRAARDDTRYSPARIEAAYWILTAGTAARLAVETWRAWAWEGW